MKLTVSGNKAIGFVERFHWICSTIPLTLLNDSIGIVEKKRRKKCKKTVEKLRKDGTLRDGVQENGETGTAKER